MMLGCSVNNSFACPAAMRLPQAPSLHSPEGPHLAPLQCVSSHQPVTCCLCKDHVLLLQCLCCLLVAPWLSLIQGPLEPVLRGQSIEQGQGGALVPLEVITCNRQTECSMISGWGVLAWQSAPRMRCRGATLQGCCCCTAVMAPMPLQLPSLLRAVTVAIALTVL